MPAFLRVRSTYCVFLNKAEGSQDFVTDIYIYIYQLTNSILGMCTVLQCTLANVQVFLLQSSKSVCSLNAIVLCFAGERSNQCPSGFLLDPVGPYCAGTFYTHAVFY